MNSRSRLAVTLFAIGCAVFATAAFASQAEGQEVKINASVKTPAKSVMSQPAMLAIRQAEDGIKSVDLRSGEPIVISMKAENATSCALYLNDEMVSGIPCSYESVAIDKTHPWYPAEGKSVTIGFSAKNGIGRKIDRIRLVR